MVTYRSSSTRNLFLGNGAGVSSRSNSVTTTTAAAAAQPTSDNNTVVVPKMSLVDQINEMQLWLLQEAKDAGKVLTVMRGYIPLLQRFGLQVDRMLIGTFLIHTQLGAWSFRYESPHHYTEHQMERDFLMKLRKTVGDDAPFRQLELGASRVRIRHTDAHIPEDVRYLFKEKGFTDMYSLPVHYRHVFSLGITWATQHPNGFTDDQIEFLEKTQPALGAILQFLVNELATYSLLCTYLGNDPGTRVHKGSVYRGDGVTIRSVLWFSDIRGFTTLSQKLGRDAIISLINQVFEITEEVLRKHGGEILKFMGDGLLAVFIESDCRKRHSVFDPPQQNQVLWAELEAKAREAELRDLKLDNDDDSNLSDDDLSDDERQSQKSAASSSSVHRSSSMGSLANGASLCEMARLAATEFQFRLQQLRQERCKKGFSGQEPHVGVGLHYGDCSYGNVGAPTRLDFTVIGPSVNLASRIEGLCSTLKSSVLASDEFVKHDVDSEAFWNCRGHHSVKGVDEPVNIYELIHEQQESPNTENGQEEEEGVLLKEVILEEETAQRNSETTTEDDDEEAPEF